VTCEHPEAQARIGGEAGDGLEPPDPAVDRVRAMLDQDAASAALGIEVLDLAPGRATMRMHVRADMVQGHGTCHGGVVFSLADSAFAAACNGRAAGPVFAASAEITWVAPAFFGDVLVAEAVEHTRYGRNGITDVTVTRQADGAMLALFRGRSVEVSGPPARPADLPLDGGQS
jgi:acyl-CoA thioesterase